MSKKILIIDDEPDLIAVAVARLMKAGYDVIESCDGESGLEKMRQEKPDLVVLDLMMPGVDGREVCRRKLEDPLIKDIPVIIFTASVHGIEDKVQELGAADYELKPFDSRSLVEKIKKLTGS